MTRAELAHLAFESGAIERHRPLARVQRRHDLGDEAIAEIDVRDLGEDRGLPRLVAVAGLTPPLRAGSDMEFAVAAVAETAVAAEPATAHAGKQAAQQVALPPQP